MVNFEVSEARLCILQDHPASSNVLYASKAKIKTVTVPALMGTALPGVTFRYTTVLGTWANPTDYLIVFQWPSCDVENHVPFGYLVGLNGVPYSKGTVQEPVATG